MKTIFRRITDWRREQRISRLARLVHKNINAKNTMAALDSFAAMKNEINARSTAQVARMERKMGISHA